MSYNTRLNRNMNRNSCGRWTRLLAAVAALALLTALLTSLVWWLAVLPRQCRHKHSLSPSTINQVSDELFDYHKKLVEQVNKKRSSWTAKLNPSVIVGKYDDWAFESPRNLTPAKRSEVRAKSTPIPATTMPSKQTDDLEIPYLEELVKINGISRVYSPTPDRICFDDHCSSIPDSFDSRQKWPLCHTVHKIYDQGRCGSCWAISVVSALSDRLCIHSNATIDDELSVQDVLECCSYCGRGCNGGDIRSVLVHWKTIGISSGGWYATSEGCKPYSFSTDCGSPCATELYRQSELSRPKVCKHTCTSAQFRHKNYFNDRQRGSHIYSLTHNEQLGRDFRAFNISLIKWDIMTRGPISTCFQLHEDFFHYESGVYQHIAGKFMYGHCVKIIGWGVERNVTYWLISNSWGRQWGEKGFAKVRIRAKKLFFDLHTVAGIPQNSIIPFNPQSSHQTGA